MSESMHDINVPNGLSHQDLYQAISRIHTMSAYGDIDWQVSPSVEDPSYPYVHTAHLDEFTMEVSLKDGLPSVSVSEKDAAGNETVVGEVNSTHPEDTFVRLMLLNNSYGLLMFIKEDE